MSTKEDTVINDCIHGLINLPGYLFKFIDTPQFQRLKNIKQLGGTYYVYPGAAHNRFEHCIGVCYLAGKLARNLQKQLNEDIEKNPDLTEAKMTDSDLKSIEIAALCHDLGHGPMSHLFDQMFYTEMLKRESDVREGWKHEIASKEMFDHLLKENEIEAKEDFDPKFVKALIEGKPFKEEKRQRYYMYEIVANERNGIDVDRMDYFARDCHGLGMKSNFDHLRYFLNCKVNIIKKTGETSICVREKEMFDLIDLFRTRDGLYRRAYRHRVTTAIQFMISDALVSANKYITVKNKGEDVTMIDSIKEGNISAYQKFTDGVLDYIMMLADDNENLLEASKILKRIYERDLYKCVIETLPVDVPMDKDKDEDPKAKISDIDEVMKKHFGNKSGKPNWIVEKVEFKTGFQDVYFYKKKDEDNFFKFQLPGQGVSKESNPQKNWTDVVPSLLLPSTFKERVFQVYTKTSKTERQGTDFKEKLDDVKGDLKEKGFCLNPLI